MANIELTHRPGSIVDHTPMNPTETIGIKAEKWQTIIALIAALGESIRKQKKLCDEICEYEGLLEDVQLALEALEKELKVK